ncbi:MAG: aldehyde ferredoxin oxidoreductase [Dehalococcoidales bacterium]|nr:aldehyde ferredoxin oxidoreductase [Dehalococcoidales bacterium]
MIKQLPGGYNGKILRVNLSDNGISVETIDELFCRKYLGGAGFVSYFLWKELKQGIDPLGADNKLILALGPVTGVSLPGSGRHCVGAKSPLTGGIAKSEVGEFWGSELKLAGYDAIIIEGRSAKPVYLWIHDGEASLRDASHLWGQKTKEAQQTIRTELEDKRVRVALIGPAGENLVRYACIMHGLFDAAGRGGLGAVMGSKNLKAIAVRGHQAPQIAEPERLKELRQWLLANMQLVHVFHEFGTGAPMEKWESTGNLPVRNFRDASFPGVKKISAVTVRDTIRIGMEACFGCPVRCKKTVKVEEPYPVDPAYGGPEYETLAALGSNCGIDNLKAIAKGNELCGAYSLDTISTGGVIAFAMECFENGLLSVKDTRGIELRFGNDEAMLKLIELIARREGIGELLAEGTARASQSIGGQAQEFAIQVKGLEAGMHEPRMKPGLGLGYMVNPHGADHCCNMHDTMYVTQEQMQALRPLGMLEPVPVGDIGPRKVALFKAVHLEQIVFDSLVLCAFLPYTFEQVADIVAAVTGWDTGVMEQLRVAERILTVARLYDIREGFTEADDTLPRRFFQSKTSAALDVKPLDPAKFEKAKSYYYTLMGWQARTGIPLPEKLEELDIT